MARILPTSPDQDAEGGHHGKPKRVDTFLRTNYLSKSKAGDIILFRAASKASAVTKAVTRSEFSHAGIVAPFEDADGPLVLYESCRASYGTPDMYWGDDAEYEGAHVFDMHERLANYQGDAWLLPLSIELDKDQISVITDYCMRHIMAKTAFDYKQMVEAGIDVVDEEADGIQMFEAEEDDTELFCTEFVCFALKEAGVFEGNPSEVTPADVLHFSFMEDPILLKNNVLKSLLSIGVDRKVADGVLHDEMLKAPGFPIISRDHHVSRYLYNRLPEGALYGCNAKAGSHQTTYHDKDGARWERSPWWLESPLLMPFGFTVRLRDSSDNRLINTGSSAVIILNRDAERVVVAEGLYEAGTYWFSDPRDAGCFSHLLRDMIPSCCYWLLCCTMFSSTYNEPLEDKLVVKQRNIPISHGETVDDTQYLNSKP